MSNQPRVAKVLTALLVSMTVGAIVLMALGNNPPSAGPFQLSSYYSLNPVEKAIFSRTHTGRDRWNYVEIFTSGTDAGNIDQIAALSGLKPEDLNCHFVICNGLGGQNGEIQATERWQRQWSSIPTQSWYGSSKTIRICLVAGKPTDFQIKRLQMLTEQLCRKYNIATEHIYYPANWQ